VLPIITQMNTQLPLFQWFLNLTLYTIFKTILYC
jgi:hypothetical protein